MSESCCPICGVMVKAGKADKDDLFPFCSERCKLIDLGHWLSDGYRIAGRGADEGEGES